jgi:hypothetical protein
MKSGTALLLIATLAAALNGFIPAGACAEGLRFDQIPAQAESYFYADIDRFIAFHLAQQLGTSKDIEAQMEAAFGGHITSATMYSLPAMKIIILIHGENKALVQVRAMIESNDVTIVHYGDQEVHCSPISSAIKAATGISGTGDKPSRPAPQSSNHGGAFSLGLGGDLGVDPKFIADDTYTTIIGPDLLVGTTDLHSMALALDVLQGKKPSLAQSDPHDLKGAVPTGAIFCGSGLTANLEGANIDAPIDTAPGSATQPSSTASPASGNFGLSLFGSFKGKAKLARFDMGEDQQNIFVHASFSMIDPASAEQLKNLMIGIKALISLSQTQVGPVLSPLQINAGENNVTLQWQWPIAKLPELVSLMQAQTDHDTAVSTPISAPSTQPTP